MNHSKVAAVLKEEAKKNPAANAVLHLCALRKRNRGTMNIAALTQRMKKEGFNYSRRDYEGVIKLLASLGLGNLNKDDRGRVRGLKDISVTLQSIGKVAVSPNTRLKTIEPVVERIDLQLPEEFKPAPVFAEEANKTFIVFFIGSKAVKVEVPSNMTAEEVALLVNKIK